MNEEHQEPRDVWSLVLFLGMGLDVDLYCFDLRAGNDGCCICVSLESPLRYLLKPMV